MVLAFKVYCKLPQKKAAGTLVPPKEGLSVVGCAEHKAAAKRIVDESITLVKNSRNELPLTPDKYKRVIIYPVEGGCLMEKAKNLGKKKLADKLADALRAEGFEPTVYKLNPLKYLSPRGVNGKKALADMSVAQFRAQYDAAIVLANISAFSVTNGRNIKWQIPMGPEIPWYATEVPTVGISTAWPFHLLDLPMLPIYVNTYNKSDEALRLTVQKLMGKSEFKGHSPVDAFCGREDTKL